MGTNNVISIVDRIAARLAAEVSSPLVHIELERDESVDDFIERLGAVIAELIDAPPPGQRGT